ncbi:MAG: chemotaxis protein CheX [Acidobacteriia bacterium]|nr:chemotaxis protein CheX [Terriglobia bacterium]
MNPPPEITASDIIEAITAATHDVFSTMLGLQIEPRGGATEDDSPAAPTSGLIALIGLAGPWTGTGSVSASGDFACRMASALLMAPCDALNENVLDAIGEIANMVIGNVKTSLEDKVGPMGLSTPTVIYGHDFQTRSARIHRWTVVPFVCCSGPVSETLYVQMCLAPNREPGQGNVRAGLQMPQVLTA